MVNNLRNMIWAWFRRGTGETPDDPFGPIPLEFYPNDLSEICWEYYFSMPRRLFPTLAASVCDFHNGGRVLLCESSDRDFQEFIPNYLEEPVEYSQDLFEQLTEDALVTAAKICSKRMQHLSVDDAMKLVTEEPIYFKSFPHGDFSEDDDEGLEADPELWTA